MFSFPDVVEQKSKRGRGGGSEEPPTEGPEESTLPDIDLRGWRTKFKKSLEFVAKKGKTDKKTLSKVETRQDEGAAKIRNRWAPVYADALNITVERMRRGVNAEETLGERVDAAPPEIQRIIRSVLELRGAL